MPLDVSTEIYIRLYFDDVDKSLKIPPPPGPPKKPFTMYTPTSQSFIIVGTQPAVSLTTVPAANTPIQVFKNGLLLNNQTSYTVDTSGVVFTFNETLTDGDIVEVYFWIPTP